MTKFDNAYAHVYFDLKTDKLGIAVYQRGVIPGFSGNLSNELAEILGQQKGYHAFLSLIGPQNMSSEMLQQGGILNYSKIEDRLNNLDLVAEQIAKDKHQKAGRSADEFNKPVTTVDLDDPLFWFDLKISQLSAANKEVFEDLPQPEKIKQGNQIKERIFKILKKPQTDQQLYQAFQKIYATIARSLNPKQGPKIYENTKRKTPPTFLASKEYDFVFYPGYKGAHNLTRVPTNKDSIYPKAGKDKWALNIIPDITDLTDIPAREMNPAELDQITEALASMFYQKLGEYPEKNFAAFNRAVLPLKAAATRMLMKLSNQQSVKTASSEISTWIDLQTGKTYKSEQQLLADQRSEQGQQLELAAQVRRLTRLVKKAKATYK